jgi:zinc protease
VAVATLLPLVTQSACTPWSRASKTSKQPAVLSQEVASPVKRLENGLRLIVRPDHRARLVAAQLWVDVGSAADPEQLDGMAHLLEHMLFKGTGQHGVGDIAREVEEAGGEINAWTSFDQTVYHLTVPRQYWRRGLAVLADCVSGARIDAAELRKEVGVVAEEISEGSDAPGTVVANQLFASAYRSHPYGRLVLGTLGSVERIRKATLSRFYRRFYRPERMTLVVVGDFEQAEVVGQARAAFVGLAGRNHPRFLPSRSARADRRARVASDPAGAEGSRAAEPAQRALRVETRRLDSRETYISVGFHIPSLIDHDTPALDLAAVVLGQGESSRLVRRVKDEQRAVTDVSAYAFSPREPGLLVISATTRPERVLEAFRLVCAEVLALARHRVSLEELQRAKAVADSDWVYQQETVDGLARQLGFYLSVAGNLDFGLDYRKRLGGVTAGSLRDTAARYLRLSNMTVAVVGPHADQRLGSALRKVAREEAAKLPTARAAAIRPPSDGEANVQRFRLPGGARLICMADSSLPLVAARAVWLGGQRFEGPKNSGINNILSLLVTRGTASRSAAEISAAIESRAGSMFGFSGRNTFGLRLEVQAHGFDESLEILADCIRRPGFEPNEVEARRQEALDELNAFDDDPSSVAVALFYSAAYRRHPYRFNPLGRASVVRGLTRETIRRYYRRFFPAGQMVLAVVGDIDAEYVRSRCAELLAEGGRKLASRGPTALVPEGRRGRPVVVRRQLDRQQAHLVIGYPGTTVTSRDRHGLELLAALLSGQSGRLFLRLRDELGLAYHLSAFSQEGIEPGRFAVHVATSPKHLEQTAEQIAQEVDRLRRDRVSAAELSRAKRYLIGAHDASLQRRAALASYLAFDELYGLGHLAHRRYAREIEAVTPRRLQALANSYFDERERVTAVVT